MGTHAVSTSRIVHHRGGERRNERVVLSAPLDILTVEIFPRTVFPRAVESEGIAAERTAVAFRSVLERVETTHIGNRSALAVAETQGDKLILVLLHIAFFQREFRLDGGADSKCGIFGQILLTQSNFEIIRLVAAVFTVLPIDNRGNIVFARHGHNRTALFGQFIGIVADQQTDTARVRKGTVERQGHIRRKFFVQIPYLVAVRKRKFSAQRDSVALDRKGQGHIRAERARCAAARNSSNLHCLTAGQHQQKRRVLDLGECFCRRGDGQGRRITGKRIGIAARMGFQFVNEKMFLPLHRRDHTAFVGFGGIHGKIAETVGLPGLYDAAVSGIERYLCADQGFPVVHCGEKIILPPVVDPETHLGKHHLRVPCCSVGRGVTRGSVGGDIL